MPSLRWGIRCRLKNDTEQAEQATSARFVPPTIGPLAQSNPKHLYTTLQYRYRPTREDKFTSPVANGYLFFVHVMHRRSDKAGWLIKGFFLVYPGTTFQQLLQAARLFWKEGEVVSVRLNGVLDAHVRTLHDIIVQADSRKEASLRIEEVYVEFSP